MRRNQRPAFPFIMEDSHSPCLDCANVLNTNSARKKKKKAAFQLKQRSFLVQFSIRLRPSKHTESLAWNSEGSTSSCRWKAECIAVKVGERRRRRLVVVTICFSLHLLSSSARPPAARSPFIADLQIFPNQSRIHPQKTEFQPPQAIT